MNGDASRMMTNRAALLFDEDDFYLYGHDFCDSFQFEEVIYEGFNDYLVLLYNKTCFKWFKTLFIKNF